MSARRSDACASHRPAIESRLSLSSLLFCASFCSLCSFSRSKLPLKAVGTLRAYFLAHIDHPFPRDTDKARLAEECGLAFKQVSDWFTNTRKRFWRPYADRLERLGCGLVARPTAQPCTCRTKKAAPAEAAAAAAAAPGSAAAPEDAAEAAPVGLPIHSWPNM